MENFKKWLWIPKWGKVALIALSTIAFLLLVATFALQSWSDSRIESANLIFSKSADLESGYAYGARAYFQRLDFLLRSSTISRIDLVNVAWASGIDSNAIQSIETHNRRLNFTTTQQLNLDLGANLGVMSYKIDFSPLKKNILKYAIIFYGIMFFMIFVFRKLFIKYEADSLAQFLRNINAGFDNTANLSQIQIICLHNAFALLIFATSLFMLSTLGFIATIPINALYFYMALGISVFALLYKNTYKIPSVIIFVCIFALSLILAINFYDYSWDGRAYHQIGIYFLANEWNPIYEKMSSVSALSQFLSHELWVECYMKFAEITQSCIYKTFGLIESGKMINYILAFGAFAYAIHTLSKIKNINMIMAILLSFLAVFSPVVVAQISTYYIDGLLGCGLIYVFLSILNLEIQRNHKKIHYVIFILTLIATASIKLTGLAYAGFIGIAYFTYKIFIKDFSGAKKVFASGAIATTLIIACNVNPLLTNQFQHGHFGYPLMGKDKVDIITNNAPKNFANLNRFEKLGLSLFSKYQNLASGSSSESTKLKIPFIKNIGEEGMGIPDNRVSGFGYFFGGIVILCMLMTALNAQAFKDRRFWLWFGLIFGSCAINPEMWWSRYVPQMWLIPFIFVIFSYYFAPKIFASLIRVAILGFLMLSVAISIAHTSPSGYTNDINNNLSNLKSDEILLYLPKDMEKSFGVKLLERGYKIRFISLDELESLKSNGTKFYRLDVLDSYGDKVALWNIAPKASK